MFWYRKRMRQMQERIDCGDRFEKSLMKEVKDLEKKNSELVDISYRLGDSNGTLREEKQALINENSELLMLVSKLESKNELLRGHLRNIQVVMESRYNEDGLFAPLDGKQTAKFVADVIKDYLEMEGK